MHKFCQAILGVIATTTLTINSAFAGDIELQLAELLRYSSASSYDLYHTSNELNREDHDHSLMAIKQYFLLYEQQDIKQYIQAFLTNVDQLISTNHIKTTDDAKELETLYNNFLQIITAVYPEWQLAHSYYQEPQSDHNIFSLEYIYQHITEILFYLATEHHIPLEAILFEDFSAFVKQLDNDFVEQSKIAILRHTLAPHQPHVTPILARKRDNKIELVILDSLGVPYDKPQYHQKYKEIGLHFVEQLAHELSPSDFQSPITIYGPKICRQQDMLSCALFSIQDIKAFLQADFFEHIAQLEQLEKIHTLEKIERIIPEIAVTIKLLDVLPPNLMGSLQNLRELPAYLDMGTTVFGVDAMAQYQVSQLPFYINHALHPDYKVNYRNRIEFFNLSRQLILSKL